MTCVAASVHSWSGALANVAAPLPKAEHSASRWSSRAVGGACMSLLRAVGRGEL